MIYNFSKFKQLHVKPIYSKELLGCVYYKFILRNLFTNKKYFDLKITKEVPFKTYLNFLNFNNIYKTKKKAMVRKIYSFLNVVS